MVEDGWWMTGTLVHDCSASLLPSASKVTLPPKQNVTEEKKNLLEKKAMRSNSKND